MANLETSLSSIPSVLRSEILRVFTNPKIQTAQDDPWSGRVLEWLESYCSRTGKGIRPLLVAVGAAAARQTTIEDVLQDPRVRKAMVIIELTHKRLLLADDIADRDETRNNEPAFHILVEQWLETQPSYAVMTKENRQHFARTYSEVAGIWLQQIVSVEQCSLAEDLETHAWKQLVLDMDRHTYQATVAGWYTLMDQNIAALDENVSRDRFLKGLELQTAHYSFIAPLLVGQAFGRADESRRNTTIEFGKAIGVLFQLSDDTLGLFGDPQKTGKPVGGDVREGKKTLFVQELMARVPPDQQTKLQSLVGKLSITEPEMNWIRDLVKNSGAWEAVQTSLSEYHDRAQRALSTWAHPETQELLQQLVVAVQQRDK